MSPDNVGFVVREGDLCLLAVDNHPTRALVDRHIAGLTDVTLISGGNDETDGNVQLVRRRDGYSVDGHLTEIHPEIGLAAESDVMPGTGCAALAAERPQLVVTNLMVASAMLNCLWAVTEQAASPTARSTSTWSTTRLAAARGSASRPARRRGVWINRCTPGPGRRHAALPGLTHHIATKDLM